MNINCTIYWYGYRNRALTSKREVIGEMGCRNRGTIDILFVWDESKLCYSFVLLYATGPCKLYRTVYILYGTVDVEGRPITAYTIVFILLSTVSLDSRI